jgi:hypothetical protein
MRVANACPSADGLDISAYRGPPTLPDQHIPTFEVSQGWLRRRCRTGGSLAPKAPADSARAC